jgi:tetratricopeptide (TPR) repeat protein
MNLVTRIWHWLINWRDEDGAEEPSPGRRALWRQLKSIEALSFRVFFFLGIFIAIYSFAQAQDAFFSRDAYKILGILLGVSIAAASFGGFLGFLFGIPRLLQQPARTVQPDTPGFSSPATDRTTVPSSNAAKRFFASNTNLEEISDWLTKIIVGISLVQATTILATIKDAAATFQSNALPDAIGADVVFVLIIISAAVVGFLFFYMETRTRVTLLFADIENVSEVRDVAADRKILNAVLEAPIVESMTDTGNGGTTAAKNGAPEPISEDRKILAVPYDQLQTSQQLAAWASAQARANNFSAAIRALQDAIAKNPGDRDLLLRLADIQQRRGNVHAVYDLLTEAQDKSKDDPQLLKRELIVSLYLGAPESFQKALPIVDKLLTIPTAANDPFVWAWSAAAQGQRYRWLVENNGDEVQKADARSKALTAVKRVIELAPDPTSAARILLRQMFDPEREQSPLDENDLELFKNDPEFRVAIYGPGNGH